MKDSIKKTGFVLFCSFIGANLFGANVYYNPPDHHDNDNSYHDNVGGGPIYIVPPDPFFEPQPYYGGYYGPYGLMILITTMGTHTITVMEDSMVELTTITTTTTTTSIIITTIPAIGITITITIMITTPMIQTLIMEVVDTVGNPTVVDMAEGTDTKLP